MQRAFKRTPTSLYHVLILLAPQFDEEFVIACLAQLRTAGLGVGLVGLRALPTQGCFGMTLQPDLTLGDIAALPGAQEYALILPGTADCLATLLADPRVIELIDALFETGSEVALLTIPLALTLLHQAGVTVASEQLLLAAEWSELEYAIGRMITKAKTKEHQL